MGSAAAWNLTVPWRVTFETGTERATARPSVNEAIDAVLHAADAGLVRDRAGRPLTPHAVGELHWCLSGHVSDSLGQLRLADVRARQLEALLDELQDSGVSLRRMRPIVTSLQTLYGHAVERGLVRDDPTRSLAFEPGRLQHEARAAPAGMSRADVLISRGLQLATAGFTLTAVVLLAESL
jgi:hypothetical protein